MKNPYIGLPPLFQILSCFLLPLFLPCFIGSLSDCAASNNLPNDIFFIIMDYEVAQWCGGYHYSTSSFNKD